ncbi:MAG: C4-type zinc ribbon domain-containing protein [Candidatus Bipolaricaulota bacterium]|nr:C4-type zinc ribbon domain-containing protein [Candidatus Bipolaricaulota bacterium]
MNDALSRLRKLAEADALLRKLEGRLADLHREEEHLRARLAAEDEAWARRQEAHRALRRAATDRSAEVDDTDAKIRLYSRKLEHDILPYKEMEYLREQVTFLRARLDELTEEALRLMAEAEEDERRLQLDREEHLARRRKLEEELSAVARRREETLGERAEARTRREALHGDVPPHLRAAYDRLLSAGNPVVPVQGGSCGGCHLRLAETTLEKVKADREVVTCEHCSRFLYWPS